ncbi:FMN reductase [Frankia sp. EI5c]|uniref:NADPH-dependent FMN reductase n=1 Tax=Frankia sp. EI5c TaxID=683316 RepID=UPI0007C39116|nr:NADPH-dependent FMN reductase [Frankia sp. EI5c]OAA23881.1 FMN reductase [Frankia sp. EI5c]
MSAPPSPRGTTSPHTSPHTSPRPSPRPSLVVLAGSLRAPSRTSTVARLLARQLADALPVRRPGTVELAPIAPDLFTDTQRQVRAELAAVRGAGVLVVATPAYRGQYTGLLKAFLDLLPPDALAGTLTVPVIVARSAEHRLTADITLRAVLTELGAALPVRSLTLLASALDDVEQHSESWIRTHLPVLRAVLSALAPPTAPFNGSRPAA